MSDARVLLDYERHERSLTYAREYMRRRRLDPSYKAHEKAYRKKYASEYYQRNKEAIKAKVRAHSEKPEVKARQKVYRVKYHQTVKAERKARRDAVRDELLSILGRACVRCGFDDKRALQFDHIHGGGGKDAIRHGGTLRMYRYYCARPDTARERLQTLCANCNWIKRAEQNEVAYQSTTSNGMV